MGREVGRGMEGGERKREGGRREGGRERGGGSNQKFTLDRSC